MAISNFLDIETMNGVTDIHTKDTNTGIMLNNTKTAWVRL